MNNLQESIIAKILSFIAPIIVILLINGGIVSRANANSEYIKTIHDVKDITEYARGFFFEGEDVPCIKENQVALPINNLATGKILGYIVADMDRLVLALKAAGYIGTASTITDSEAQSRNVLSESNLLIAEKVDIISSQEEVPSIEQTMFKEVSLLNKEYYVQVGAWKNPNYAQETLVKLKQYYSESYIVVENNFHKARIPGVMDKKQGAIISKDIEEEFNLKPIVILKKESKVQKKDLE